MTNVDAPSLERYHGVIVDWVGFTLPVREGQNPMDVVGPVVEWLGGSKLANGFGRYGYLDSYTVLGTGAVYWHPTRNELGVHVELPSSALATFAEYRKLAPVDVLEWVSVRSGWVTRLDVAIDSYQISMAQVMAAYYAGQIVTRIQHHQLITNLTSSLGGQTLYLGGKESRRKVRFYDKAAEQQMAGATWTRCEVQFRGDYAQQATSHLATVDDARRLISTVVDFRENAGGSDSNKGRWERAAWWSEWIGSGGRLSFASAKVEAAVLKVLDWVRVQCGPSLAMLSTAFNHDRRWLYDVMFDGFGRLPDYKFEMAHTFRDSRGKHAVGGLCHSV